MPQPQWECPEWEEWAEWVEWVVWETFKFCLHLTNPLDNSGMF